MEEEYQNLTKRQRRELRKQEKEKEREKVARKSQAKKIIWAVIIIGVVVGLVYLIINTGGETVVVEDTTDPFKGADEAKVVINEYSDFQCPACKAAQPTLRRILSEYPDQVKLVYNDFPLASHKFAELAAQAAQCAQEQGKFWEYHDELFDNQKSWSDGKNVEETFQGYAADLGLEAAKFNKCLEDKTYEERTDADRKEGRAQKVNSTPTFFVNNQRVVGAKSFDDFKAIIEEELAK